MPLSKAEQAKWMREYRRRVRQGGVIPKPESVIPKVIGVLEGVQPDNEGYYPAWAITSQFNGRVRQMQLPNYSDGSSRCLNGVWLVI